MENIKISNDGIHKKGLIEFESTLAIHLFGNFIIRMLKLEGNQNFYSNLSFVSVNYWEAKETKKGKLHVKIYAGPLIISKSMLFGLFFIIFAVILRILYKIRRGVW